jgi:hypothetical protein
VESLAAVDPAGRGVLGLALVLFFRCPHEYVPYSHTSGTVNGPVDLDPGITIIENLGRQRVSLSRQSSSPRWRAAAKRQVLRRCRPDSAKRFNGPMGSNLHGSIYRSTDGLSPGV